MTWFIRIAGPAVLGLTLGVADVYWYEWQFWPPFVAALVWASAAEHSGARDVRRRALRVLGSDEPGGR